VHIMAVSPFSVFLVLAAAAVTTLPAIAERPERPVSKHLSEMQHEGKALVLDMFDRAIHKYIEHAFPMDELRPVSCTGVDNFGGLAITIIDALDTMVVLHDHDLFREYAKWVCDNVEIDRDVEVSVFETNIRAVGGLLSAHFAYEEGLVDVDIGVDDYDGCLLRKAVALAHRLLPAFETTTGIPYCTINLRHGVKKDESRSTSTACGGTLLLEFVVLSAVTGDPVFERVARNAAVQLFRHRNPNTGLVGSHINISTGVWVMPEALLGVSIDSYIEYLLKAYMLTGDVSYRRMFDQVNRAFRESVMRGPGFGVEVMSTNGQLLNARHSSLANFYPGVLALNGNYVEAEAMLEHQHAVFQRYGAMPEGFLPYHPAVVNGQKGSPLRPEHVESLYHMYRATADEKYVRMGLELALAIEVKNRVPCGYASLADVELNPEAPGVTAANYFEDRMDSYFLAETIKYLYLLFDEINPLHGVASTTDSNEVHQEILREFKGRSKNEGAAAAEAEAARTHQQQQPSDHGSQPSARAHADVRGAEPAAMCGDGGPTFDELRDEVVNRLTKYGRESIKAQEDVLGVPHTPHRRPNDQIALSPSGRSYVFTTEGHFLPITAEWTDYARHARSLRGASGDAADALIDDVAPNACPLLQKLPYV
jgi:mannosidase alpha-like ER degradation enhancer 2